LLLTDAGFFGVSSGVLIFLSLIVFASKNTTKSRKYPRSTELYFSLPIFSKLDFTKATLFISTNAEFEALQDALHYKT
jgi:hypothetical protein